MQHWVHRKNLKAVKIFVKVYKIPRAWHLNGTQVIIVIIMNIITDKICLNLLNGTSCDHDNKLHKGYFENEKQCFIDK